MFFVYSRFEIPSFKFLERLVRLAIWNNFIGQIERLNGFKEKYVNVRILRPKKAISNEHSFEIDHL